LKKWVEFLLEGPALLGPRRASFEVRDLDGFCRKLHQNGFFITQLPRMMPWGWRHAYVNDPDGHEIGLYWAGENRMKKTVTKAAQKPTDIGRKT
jgi:catechol 2,3-dioxygenase-like lactoylglutathione lyase family enzyme